MEKLVDAASNRTGGIHVLHGLGGCGKTAVAQAVFNSVTRADGRIGLWVNASERSTLRAGMLAVAADRGATTAELAAAFDGQRASADLVWHYLDHSSRPWLLVLDNADDPHALAEGAWLRPSQQGTVIVTTRAASSHVWNEAELHSVGLLPVEDAAQVLCDLAPGAGTVEEAKSVARRLDCLPLAVTLAGSFLSRQLLESWSMSDYQRHLDENATELIDRGAVPGNSERNARQLVGKTWEISLRALAESGAPESTTLLRLLSCWGSGPVPLPLLLPDAVRATELSALDPPLSEKRVETALRGLLDHSLVSLVEHEEGGVVVRCIQTHGIVLDSVAAAVPQEQRRPLVASAARLLENQVPAELVRGRTPAHVRPLVPHATSLLRRVPDASTAPQVASVAVRLAGHAFEGGDYQASLFLANAAGETAEQWLGAEDPVTLRARHRAATVLFRLGRFEESETLHRNVLESRKRVLGPEHPETLESRQDIHEPIGQLRRPEESVAALRDAEEFRTRALGADHPDTLHTRALLIEYLAVTNAVTEFDEIGEFTVSACAEILGEDSFTTVTALHNFAYGLYKFSRWEQAELFARKALDGRERLHGPDHPLTLSAAVLLSWVLRERDSLEESILLGRRVVAGQERSLGREHPYLLANRTGLASSLVAAGQVAEARSLARENLPLCEQVLGADDPLTVRTRDLLE